MVEREIGGEQRSGEQISGEQTDEEQRGGEGSRGVESGGRGEATLAIMEENENARGKSNCNTTVRQPTWMGVKLFPPRRTQQNPSKAWQFGGFRKGVDGQLVKDKTVCGICGKEQIFRKTPSNLYQHLQNNHSAETGLELSAQPKQMSETPSIKDFFNKATKVSKYKSTHPKQRALVEKIVQWVILSKRPISIVDDEKLKECFELADPRLKMPSRWEVTAQIKKIYKKKKAQVVEELSEVEHFCCTNDAGSSSGAKSFVDVNVHYLTKNFEPKKKIVSVFEMKESKNAINYRSRIEKVEKSVGIEEKVFSYTTDNEATMKAAFATDNRNGCCALRCFTKNIFLMKKLA